MKLFYLLLLISFTSNSQEAVYQFNLEIDSLHANKEVLGELTQINGFFDRHIVGNSFQFKSKIPFEESFLINELNKSGGNLISFNRTKLISESLGLEKIGGVNCDAAELLCSNGAINGVSGGFGVQELPNNGTIDGCLTVEHQSSWYYLNIQSGGTLSMLIDPNVNSDDYDFAIWGPFTSATANANCPPITSPIRCSFSDLNDRTGLATVNFGTPSGCGFFGLFACGPFAVGDNSEGISGDSFVLPLNTLANQIYILLVDNFTTSSNPYTMTFGGSAVLGCTPVVLPVEISHFSVVRHQMNDLITWKTQSENNNNYFSIYHSTHPELNEWSEIDRVFSIGNSTTERSYQIRNTQIDTELPNYYKITQVDKDGTSKDYTDFVISDSKSDQKELVKIVNAMGQEISIENAHGIVFFQYADGTMERVYK